MDVSEVETVVDLSARLRITEIFHSLQGEANTVGLPTVFVRLTGCPLRCQYCDTEYAFQGGEWKTLSEILDAVSVHNAAYVTVTGGEPLAQPNCLPLLTALCDASYQVSIETSGAMDIAPIDPRVVKVVDIKTPGSGEQDKNRWQNMERLQTKDQIKFVICSRDDYEWSKQVIERYTLSSRCELLMSPSFEQIDPKDLAEWILQDQLSVRFQMQLHKLLWDDARGK